MNLTHLNLKVTNRNTMVIYDNQMILPNREPIQARFVV